MGMSGVPIVTSDTSLNHLAAREGGHAPICVPTQVVEDRL